MITHAFSLLDIKTGIYHPPFFFPHEALAVRAVVNLANDANTHISRNPLDFVLYHVGNFDDSTGVLTAGPPKLYGSAFQLAEASARQTELKL